MVEIQEIGRVEESAVLPLGISLRLVRRYFRARHASLFLARRYWSTAQFFNLALRNFLASLWCRRCVLCLREYGARPHGHHCRYSRREFPHYPESIRLFLSWRMSPRSPLGVKEQLSERVQHKHRIDSHENEKWPHRRLKLSEHQAKIRGMGR